MQAVALHLDLDVISKFLPLGVQVFSFNLISTGKLSVVMLEDIKAKLRVHDVTDLERFLSVFIYADQRGENYLKEIKELIRTVNRSYVYDLILLKLVSYFYLRSRSEAQDIEYLNLISDLVTKAKGLSKLEKHKVIEYYRLKKSNKLKEIEAEAM